MPGGVESTSRRAVRRPVVTRWFYTIRSAEIALWYNGLDGTAQVLGGINGQSIARRLTAAASAAGIEGRITGHSGRVGLAVELTRRGAPEQATAKAGGWKSSRMVAHYSAAVAAEQGAVATYL